MTPPYLLPFVLIALILCGLRSYWQALILVLAAEYIYHVEDAAMVLAFTIGSLMLGHIRASMDGDK